MQNRGPNSARKRRAPRAAFTLVELLVVIAIIGILIALLLPAVQAAREAGRRTQCGSNMHQVAIALLNYEETHKTFPPAMVYDPGENPAHTIKHRVNWLILILPQMDQRPIHQSFNLAAYISDPLNENGCDLDPVSGNWVPRPNIGDGGRSAPIPSILCPSDNKNNRIPFQGSQSGEPGNWARANVAVNCGNGMLSWELLDAKSPGWKQNNARGVFGPNDCVMSVAGITDGTAYTFLIGEMRAGVSPLDRRGTWAMGAVASMLVGYGGNWDDGAPNMCAELDPDDVMGCNTFYTDEIDVRECMGCCCAGSDSGSLQATMRSLHPGGVNAAMADASVHFISNFIETAGVYGDPNRTLWAVWDRLICSADGLPVDNKRAGL
jgi:prepilin-type N-terminal cleavage/methylation domain-containing protein/prepilin-type processing-associated H-X9-DG protein